MGQQSKTTLKTYFNTGDTPTEAQFVDLIDSFQDASAVLAATTASFTTAAETKLNGIEALADVTDAANVAAAGAVMTTGAQTVAGVKTFSSSPIVPAPTTDLQAATKKYVDDAVTAGGGYTDEAAQDAVGLILSDSPEIDFAYSDATPSISAAIVANGIFRAKLSDVDVLPSLDLADSALQAADIANVPTISIGAGVPASTPTKVGDVYIDTANDNAYIATGTASSADWEKTNDGAGGGSPGGATTEVQFNNAGAFDGNPLFAWDETNARLGVGISVPLHRLHVKGTGTTSGTNSLRLEDSAGTQTLAVNDAGNITLGKATGVSLLLQSHGNTGFSIEPTGTAGTGIRFLVNNTGNEFAFKHGTNYSFSLGRTTSSGTEGRAWFGWSASLVTTDASAQVQIDSTTRGFLPPRMTTTQRDAISSPAAGLMIYNTTTNKLNVFTTAWEAVTSS